MHGLDKKLCILPQVASSQEEYKKGSKLSKGLADAMEAYIGALCQDSHNGPAVVRE
jgi:dsRNA-specific ribonuclease